MSEQISPLIIFSVVFLAITIVILGALSQVFNANVQAQDNPEASLDVVGGITYRMWWSDLAGTQRGINISGQVTEWANWKNTGLASNTLLSQTATNTYDMQLNSRVHFSFYDQKADGSANERHRLDVWVVRNNTGYETKGAADDNTFLRANWYRDFVFFREYAWTGNWFDTRSNWYAIKSFDDILEQKAIGGTNATKTSFVGKYNVSAFFGPSLSGGGNTSGRLYNNTASIQVGTDLFNIDMGGKIGMWTLLSDLLTFKMQDVPKPMNYILGIPLWIAISLAFVAIVSRFIPTIPGL